MRRIIEEGGLAFVYFFVGGTIIALLATVLTALSTH